MKVIKKSTLLKNGATFFDDKEDGDVCSTMMLYDALVCLCAGYADGVQGRLPVDVPVHQVEGQFCCQPRVGLRNSLYAAAGWQQPQGTTQLLHPMLPAA